MSDPYLWNIFRTRNDQLPQKNLAILIDTENSSPYKIIEILNEISTIGKTSVKRAYGDWTSTKMGVWKKLLHRYAIQPIQQFTYTKGKNNTDAALIIDAMDLLYSGHLDGFCIVSSDSDYTKLAVRIRESGLLVYGFGEKKTPEAFAKACDKFTYVENLSRPLDFKRMQELLADENLVNLIKSAIVDASDESGWSHMGRVGQILYNREPDFDFQAYGFSNLTDLIVNMGIFNIEERRIPDTPNSIIYVRFPMMLEKNKK